MERDPLAAARPIAELYMARLAGDMVDGRTLVMAVTAGYLAGSGVPTDEAVRIVEQMAASALVEPVPRNPMYHGLPWMVPGPTSGVPYYAD